MLFFFLLLLLLLFSLLLSFLTWLAVIVFILVVVVVAIVFGLVVTSCRCCCCCLDVAMKFLLQCVCKCLSKCLVPFSKFTLPPSPLDLCLSLYVCAFLTPSRSLFVLCAVVTLLLACISLFCYIWNVGRRTIINRKTLFLWHVGLVLSPTRQHVVCSPCPWTAHCCLWAVCLFSEFLEARAQNMSHHT